MMSVRWLGATEPTLRILFYYFLLSTAMSVPVAATDFAPITAAAWPWLVAVGVAQLSSQVLIIVGYRYAPAEKLGPFIYSVIVFTALIDWLVWHHRPALSTYAGMALVIGGACWRCARKLLRLSLFCRRRHPREAGGAAR